MLGKHAKKLENMKDKVVAAVKDGDVEGEVERKMRLMVEEVFNKYNPGNRRVNSDGKPYLRKEEMREFIKEIMDACGQTEAWTEEEFESGYSEFDKDGSGEVDQEEFSQFVKRFADL